MKFLRQHDLAAVPHRALMIIDTHLHLIDLSTLRYPGSPGRRRLTATFPGEYAMRLYVPALRPHCTWKSMSTGRHSG
jgi:hypothetical protein